MLYCTCHALLPFSIPSSPTTDHQFPFSSPRTPKQAWLRKISTAIKSCSKGNKAGASEPKDYYGLLGVSVNSSPHQIKEAYRRLQKQHHPDIAGQKGHEFTLLLNEAYHALREDERRRMMGKGDVRNGGIGSNFSGLGCSSWNGAVRPQGLFVDENKCIGCRECVHHAGNTFAFDEALGCARVKLQYGDHEKNIEVSVESCPVNCIHWVESDGLPLLEFLMRPQPKEAYGVFGGGWERPAQVFAAADSLREKLKLKQQQQSKKH